jgi:hypothetical protein
VQGGAALVRVIVQEFAMKDLVLIRAFANRFEAELAQQYLADQGIDAMVQADDAGGMYAGFTLSRKGVRLFVRPEDAETAIEILEPEDGREADDGYCDDADFEVDDDLD